jgi:hypothetical protein
MVILGPGEQVHAPLPELTQPVFLHSQGGQLAIRHAGEFFVDGQRCFERSTLSLNARIRVGPYAFALEGLTR